jgi:hypothetical protein
VLSAESSRDLAAYVVWVPQLGAQASNVPDAMGLVPDKRAYQYWNGDDWLGGAYGHVLSTPDAAWDVYLLYPRGVRWTAATPPKPSFWMQQLAGVTIAPRLDANVFREHVEEALRE